jgi:hypothetical protein
MSFLGKIQRLFVGKLFSEAITAPQEGYTLTEGGDQKILDQSSNPPD